MTLSVNWHCSIIHMTCITPLPIISMYMNIVDCFCREYLLVYFVMNIILIDSTGVFDTKRFLVVTDFEVLCLGVQSLKIDVFYPREVFI